MKMKNDFSLTRRGFLAASLIVSDILFNRTAGGLDAIAATVELEPTPACADTDDITPALAFDSLPMIEWNGLKLLKIRVGQSGGQNLFGGKNALQALTGAAKAEQQADPQLGN